MMKIGRREIGFLKTPKKRILIVDDEEDLTWSIVRRLSRDKKNLEILCANSGNHALDLMKRKSIDLLVTDLRMPDIDGRELIQRVRSDYPHISIILMTAFFSLEIREFVRRFQVAGFMEKPFDMEDLRILIYTHLCLGESTLDEGRIRRGQP
jgi:DNA-binding NtrC family response regulator